MAAANQQSNIDKKQIDHFNDLVKIWWDTTGTVKLLHRMNAVRIPVIVQGLATVKKITQEVANSANPLEGFKILDVGCGGGILTEELAKRGGDVTGLDAASDLLECARIHAEGNKTIKGNLQYICDTIENFSLNNAEKFDVVVASEVIEHVQSPDRFVEACIKTLKPGGYIYITTINKTTRSWLREIILYEHILKCIPKGTHDWNMFVAPETLQRILNNHKCNITILDGWTYNYFTGTFNITSDLSGFYYVQAMKHTM